MAKPAHTTPFVPRSLGESEAVVAAGAALPRRSGLLGTGGRRASVIEAMLLLAFLGFSLALILQLFAAASSLSRKAHDDSMLHLAANNAMQSAMVSSQPPLGQHLYFDEQASPCAEDAARYVVDVRAEGEPLGPGTMFDITAYAYLANDPASSGFSLNTKHYVPRASKASASGDGGSGESA